MTKVVLDSSALIAYFNGEPGGEIVDGRVTSGLLSAVNLAEVVTKMVQQGGTPDRVRAITSTLSCEIAPLDAELGVSAGIFHASTRAFGLSLGDCVCLALAIRENLPVLTADRAWATLDLPIPVTLIR